MTAPDPTTPCVVVTGAAGRVGRQIVPLLGARWRLRLFDLNAPGYETDAEVMIGSILDDRDLDGAMEGAYAVVHLAGIADEAPWPDILATNIEGTQHVLAAARRAGVHRIVQASSIHAVGSLGVPDPGTSIPDGLLPQPDSYYGVSKATVEALGAFYHHRDGMDVVSIRLGTCQEQPSSERALATWISPRDLTNLITAGLTAPSPLNAVVWGMSNNSARWFDLNGARALGWEPLDDGADHAERIRHGLPAGPMSEGERRWIGGGYYQPVD